MADSLVGKWESVSYENMEPFWDALGVPEQVRVLAREQKTQLTIAKEGESWKLTTVAGGRSRESVFPVGQEVDTITMSGAPVKATLTVEGSELVEVEKLPHGDLTIRRGIVDGQFRTMMTVKGVTASISFNRV